MNKPLTILTFTIALCIIFINNQLAFAQVVGVNAITGAPVTADSVNQLLQMHLNMCVFVTNLNYNQTAIHECHVRVNTFNNDWCHNTEVADKIPICVNHDMENFLVNHEFK